jgi:hypothetical protein
MHSGETRPLASMTDTDGQGQQAQRQHPAHQCRASKGTGAHWMITVKLVLAGTTTPLRT